MRILAQDKFDRLRAKALAGSATPRIPNTLVWNLAGACEAPRVTTFQTSKTIRDGAIDLHVRCRTCSRCLRQRKRAWRARAHRESAREPNIWFGTLTFGPPARAEMLAAIEGVECPDERKRILIRIAGQHLTKYLKRVRKTARFRYFAAPEPHRDGMIHWHVLLYGDVRWRSLAAQWHQKVGFCLWKKVRPDDLGDRIAYVAKYLTKASHGRVRASLGFGRQASGADTLSSIATPNGARDDDSLCNDDTGSPPDVAS